MIPLIPIVLDIVYPLNETRSRFFVITIDWRIDQDKYFMPIYCYNISLIALGIVIVVGIDATYITSTAHACSLFLIIG